MSTRTTPNGFNLDSGKTDAFLKAWQEGGEHIYTLTQMGPPNQPSVDYYVINMLYARWGKRFALDTIIWKLESSCFDFILTGKEEVEYRLLEKLFMKLPESFPLRGFTEWKIEKTAASTCAKAADWYRIHRHQLEWDSKKRKYYFKD